MNYSENIKYDFIDSELFFEKIEKIKKHNSDKEGLKYTTLTYGCQMNGLILIFLSLLKLVNYL